MTPTSATGKLPVIDTEGYDDEKLRDVDARGHRLVYLVLGRRSIGKVGNCR